MRRQRVYSGHRVRKSITHCKTCRGHIEAVGDLSKRGMCASCALVHRVAHFMGMTHVTYVDESISAGIRLRYDGPVIKAA